MTSTAGTVTAGSTSATTGGMGAAAGTTSTAGMAAAGSTAAMAGGTEAAAGTRTATQAITTAGKRLTPPKTTSHKKQKKKDTGDVRIRVGKHIKITCSALFHVLKSKAQQDCLIKDVANSYPYFGTVVKGGGMKSDKKRWDVCFDVLPHEDQIIENMAWTKLSVLVLGEEETATQQYTASQSELLQQIEKEANEMRKKMSPMVWCQKEIAENDKDTLASAKVFTMT